MHGLRRVEFFFNVDVTISCDRKRLYVIKCMVLLEFIHVYTHNIHTIHTLSHTYSCSLTYTHTHTLTHTHTHTHIYMYMHALHSELAVNFNSTNYVVNEDEGTVTVCVEKTRQTDRNFMVNITASETSPAEAEGNITIEPTVSTTTLCKGALVASSTYLFRSLQPL